ncbi:MAG TPA: DUF177 domain-containing protein [Gemmatimonadaceae bacterium]|nr:DUF177 domain-containing protein [Gemmatimonadaceae bacterium]
MLSFDLRSLESKAVQVDDYLGPDDPVWEEEDPRPAAPLHVTGRLSSAGAGRFYWHGRIVGDAAAECRRCLVDVAASVTDETHVIFAESDDVSSEDPDVVQIDSRQHELDLRPVVREQWLLAAPAYSLCRDDCKGLCPRCGSDLNRDDCGCAERASDPRWDALGRINATDKQG